jgi:1-acyl-sn-glycerol-3-phosphate acyltransferase
MLLLFGSQKLVRLRRWFGRVMIVAGFHRLEVTSPPIVDEGAYIYLFNHQSFWDIFIVAASIPYHFSAIGKKELLSIPLFGFIVKRYGIVCIDRSDHKHSMNGLREAIEMLKAGVSLVIFPEGTRSQNGNVGVFKNGSFVVAADSRATIVPAGISGAYGAAPYDTWLLYPFRTLRVKFGTPIPYEAYEELSIAELNSLVRSQIIHLAAQSN